jgi:hypothetical protein
VNTGSETAIVFDPSTDAVIGSVSVTGVGPGANAAIISKNGVAGLVGVGKNIYVVDMDSDPPTLGTGINPIEITPTTKDLVAATNEALYIACGSGVDASAVVSVFSFTGDISTFDPGNNGAVSVDICDDGTTVLVATMYPAVVKKLTLAENGTLSDTGQFLDPSEILESTPYIANVYCSPGSQVGAVVTSVGADLVSFTIDDMTAVERRDLAASVLPAAPRNAAGLSGAFTSDGHFYVRSSEEGGEGYIEKFDIDSATGVIGEHPGILPILAGAMPATQGPEVFSIYQAGDKIFVPMPWDNEIIILSATTSDRIGTITSDLFNLPTSIAIVEPPE